MNANKRDLFMLKVAVGYLRFLVVLATIILYPFVLIGHLIRRGR
jgi:hypothetical protein